MVVAPTATSLWYSVVNRGMDPVSATGGVLDMADSDVVGHFLQLRLFSLSAPAWQLTAWPLPCAVYLMIRTSTFRNVSSGLDVIAPSVAHLIRFAELRDSNGDDGVSAVDADQRCGRFDRQLAQLRHFAGDCARAAASLLNHRQPSLLREQAGSADNAHHTSSWRVSLRYLLDYSPCVHSVGRRWQAVSSTPIFKNTSLARVRDLFADVALSCVSNTDQPEGSIIWREDETSDNALSRLLFQEVCRLTLGACLRTLASRSTSLS